MKSAPFEELNKLTLLVSCFAAGLTGVAQAEPTQAVLLEAYAEHDKASVADIPCDDSVHLDELIQSCLSSAD